MNNLFFPFRLQLQAIRPITTDILIIVEEIINLFLGGGVHLDAVNIDGLTATQTCTISKFLLFILNFISFSFYTYFNKSCLYTYIIFQKSYIGFLICIFEFLLIHQLVS